MAAPMTMLVHRTSKVRTVVCSLCHYATYGGVFTNKKNDTERNSQSALLPSHVVAKHAQVDKQVASRLEAQEKEFISYKTHDGIMKCKKTQLPSRLVKAMRTVMARYPWQSVASKADDLVNFLYNRQPPLTDREINRKAHEIEAQMMKKSPIDLHDLNEEDLQVETEKHRKAVLNRLRKTVYHWEPINFDNMTSMAYLYGRMAYDFSVISQCFHEISKREPDFSPTSLYHYGSKVGAGIWASDIIWPGIEEHYCVDHSPDMNNVASLLLEGGSDKQRVSYNKRVHFRMFQPSSKDKRFGVVLSPFMLMEQSSYSERRDMVLALWEMTQSYLILIENGTTAGFSLIDEAKNTILKMSQLDGTEKFQGHVFAPCPHDKPCPKMAEERLIPCVTDVPHSTIQAAKTQDRDKAVNKIQKQPGNVARYSYIIMKKGRRLTDAEWPRVVKQMKRSRHVHCHLCLPCGQLQHTIISKSCHRHTYGCAKYVGNGDRLPITLSSEPDLTSSAGETHQERKIKEH